MIFLKLGGSLITDKTQVETVRPDVLQRIAQEIKTARDANPDLRLVLGHGSGSFGHVAGAKHGTRNGVHSTAQWHGFAEVAQAAAKLNALVRDALMAVGIPVVSILPRSSVICEDGVIKEMGVQPIQAALDVGIVPIVMGDVAFDTVRGGTIVSTEEVMSYLANHLHPNWLLLAGETEGVYDHDSNVIPRISHGNFAEIRSALGGSRGTDVTGGMLSKVSGMLALVSAHPQLNIRIFSGLAPKSLEKVLSMPSDKLGTQIHTSLPTGLPQSISLG